MFQWWIMIKNEACYEKTCLMPYANNKSADQPAHPRSLISTFIVRCLHSIISPVSFFAISWFESYVVLLTMLLHQMGP